MQSKPGTWGHCTVGKVWKRKEDDTYEMNIAAEVLDREIEEIIDTILHEMVHLYCRENGIQEVSRGGKYHNGKFKDLAEKCGLQCVKQGQYGWNTEGAGNEKLIAYALEKGWTEIRIARGGAMRFPISTGAGGLQSGGITIPGGKRPSSTRKLQCPKCGCSCRATKDIRIMCMDCNEQMKEV